MITHLSEKCKHFFQNLPFYFLMGKRAVFLPFQWKNSPLLH